MSSDYKHPGGPFRLGHPKFGGRVKGTPNKVQRKPGDAIQLSKQYTSEVVAFWVNLMRGEDKELAFRAACKLMERGHGGTPLPVRLGGPDGEPLDFGSMTDDQLDTVILRLQQYLAGAAVAGRPDDAEGETSVH